MPTVGLARPRLNAQVQSDRLIENRAFQRPAKGLSKLGYSEACRRLPFGFSMACCPDKGFGWVRKPEPPTEGAAALIRSSQPAT